MSRSKRIAVNLAPADLVKEGAHFDLPIALGLMTAMGVLPADSVVLGELSLDGSSCNESQSGALCPSANGPEAERWRRLH